MTLTIITNGHRRELLTYREWLTETSETYRGDFDYIGIDDMDSPRIVRYLGSWYDTSDMMRAPESLRPTWDCMLADTFFSGILVRFLTDATFADGFVVMGRCYA